MHGDEQRWVDEAIQTNWVSTVGANIDTVEKMMAEYVGVMYAVGLSCGTAALHLSTNLAGERLYGQWVGTDSLGDYNCISFIGNKFFTAGVHKNDACLAA